MDAIVKYAERFPDYVPNYAAIINKGLALGAGLSSDGVERLKQFALQIINQLETTSFDQIYGVSESFRAYGYVKEATFLLLEICKRDNCGEASAAYQTAIIEMNLEADPAFAE